MCTRDSVVARFSSLLFNVVLLQLEVGFDVFPKYRLYFVLPHSPASTSLNVAYALCLTSDWYFIGCFIIISSEKYISSRMNLPRIPML